ncbi:hypothetical protein BXZ70DRAFT_924178 [Cristinia sonorae]|uniref:Uncharacterized protein n=1 Tax=Cristinia sonorae TaxID=1940300 RepID=A0A8K0XSV1_9AGAR|nr:hypothetical protein BXZ70DRAFT_924178 [Cristinia sonorae]
MFQATSRRPLKTYSHRRGRVYATPSTRPSFEDEPRVKDSDLPHHRRPQRINHPPDGLITMDIDGGDMDDDSMFSSPEMPRNQVLPMKVSATASYETPYISFPKDPSIVSRSTSSGSLSPVPALHRVLSPVCSRNLNENLSRRSLRGLASPFNSRPGSRAASPDFSTQGPAKRPRIHAKSRTLSSDMATLTQIPDGSARNSTSAGLQAKAQTTNHGRTASIPVISSVSLDHLDPDIWAIPPKALSRSPTSFGDHHGELEHPSFYFDVPDAVSTPARKTRKISSIYTEDYFFAGGEASLGEAAPIITPVSPPPGRRRRRTILQAPDDSLFSSMLDFSAYVTDEESPGHIRKCRGHRPSSVLQQSDELPQRSIRAAGLSVPGAGLGSAFSLTSGDPDDDVELVTEDNVFASNSASMAGRGLHGKELSSLFSNLDISVEDVSSTHDSSSKHSDPKNESASDFLHTAKSGHRRKRGDTIRASDFNRPPTDVSISNVLPSVSSDNLVNQPQPGPSRNTRRLRSGTITLANVREVAASEHSPPGIIEKVIPRAKQEQPKQKRRREVLPQFKRIIHDRPLTPQGSDDSDDELLLTGVVWREPEPSGSAT